MTEEAITLTHAEFTNAVASAAQMVAAVHRRRLVMWGFVAGLLATALIALPTVFVVAKQNCREITRLGAAQEENFTEGIASRGAFLRQSRDRFGLSDQQFRALLKRSDESQRKQLSAIRSVARTDCRYL